MWIVIWSQQHHRHGNGLKFPFNALKNHSRTPFKTSLKQWFRFVTKETFITTLFLCRAEKDLLQCALIWQSINYQCNTLANYSTTVLQCIWSFQHPQTSVQWENRKMHFLCMLQIQKKLLIYAHCKFASSLVCWCIILLINVLCLDTTFLSFFLGQSQRSLVYRRALPDG